MQQKLNAVFEIASWKETTQQEFADGRKINVAGHEDRYPIELEYGFGAA